MIRTSRIGSGPTSSAPASSVRRGAGSTGRLRGEPPPALLADDPSYPPPPCAIGCRSLEVLDGRGSDWLLVGPAHRVLLFERRTAGLRLGLAFHRGRGRVRRRRGGLLVGRGGRPWWEIETDRLGRRAHELVGAVLQQEYDAWRDGLPESLVESKTGERLAGVCEALDTAVDALEGVDLPPGVRP